MDAQVVFIAISGVVLTSGIAIGRQMTVRRDINTIDQRLHKIAGRLDAIPPKPDDVYARKDTVAIELGHIRESQQRMEEQLSRLLERA